ncbi:hypothetical protein FKM82_019888 [Ascaphus truei]
MKIKVTQKRFSSKVERPIPDSTPSEYFPGSMLHKCTHSRFKIKPQYRREGLKTQLFSVGVLGHNKTRH